MFELIVCVDNKNGIGKDNTIPWYISNDLKRFKIITTTSPDDKINVVIMGNSTFKSIGKKLPNRINIVLTKSTNNMNEEDLLYFNNKESILMYIYNNMDKINKVFIIGGSKIYQMFLELQIVDTIHLTKIKHNYECDTFLDTNLINKYYKEINNISFVRLVGKERENDNNDVEVNFITLKYQNKEELSYLTLLDKIINKGTYKIDRTEVGIFSLFGKHLKFNVRNWRLPLYSHRRMFYRGIIEELLFFLRGETDTTVLKDNGVKIWQGHTSREFLNSRKLYNYKEGEYGPMYGYLLRHWGYPYKGIDHDYTNKGFDQLQYVINEIKTNPTSRRILLSYWNPSVFNEQPLYCCHVLYQFYVNIDKHEISCMFTMRSNDAILANNFNLVSCTLLLFIICKLTGYMPGKVVYSVNDCHIYKNQIDAYNQFKYNEPKTFPLCYINDFEKVEDLKFSDFNIMFYSSHKAYKIPMSI